MSSRNILRLYVKDVDVILDGTFFEIMINMIKTYRNKIKEKRAIQWDGTWGTFSLIFHEFAKDSDVQVAFDDSESFLLKIKNCDGNCTVANIGDYIIQGISGCIYPCREDIFHESYEEVASEDT